MNAENPQPNSPTCTLSTAAHGSDARLTFATLAAILTEMPPPPKWRACVTRPEHLERFRRELPAAESTVIATDFGGIRLYAKPHQLTAAWMFSDEKTLQRYLNDDLTELDLLELMRSGVCHPNDQAHAPANYQ